MIASSSALRGLSSGFPGEGVAVEDGVSSVEQGGSVEEVVFIGGVGVVELVGLEGVDVVEPVGFEAVEEVGVGGADGRVDWEEGSGVEFWHSSSSSGAGEGATCSWQLVSLCSASPLL